MRELLTAMAIALAAPAAVLAQDAPPDRWLGPDKPVHLLAGYAAAGAGYAAAVELDATSAKRRRAAIAAGAAAALLKEAADGLGDGDVSWKDLVFDAAGIALFVTAASAAE